ncbi:MAG TPA: alanine racemase, partial [Mycobacteriales bacterium]|nr:alanine racemase [Mycobacteriales bacterium]
TSPAGTGTPPGPAAVVDLDAIAASVAACAAAAPGAQVMAVVKADGYGHGLVASAHAAVAGGAGWLGTATIIEGLALRTAGLRVPILSWLNPPGTDFGSAVVEGIDIGVSAPWGLDDAVAAARAAGVPARIHLKIDTGLHRNGATLRDLDALLDVVARAQAEGVVEVVGMMTHFVHADLPDHPTTGHQLADFTYAVERAAAQGIRPLVRHCANSAATLTRPDTHFELVRPGIACYGLTPTPQLGGPERFGLVPAMTLTAPVALVKTVAAGLGVSYGHLWTAERDETVALVPLGYADGIPRHASNTGEVLIGGQRRRIAGRVCMDQFVVTCPDEVRPGDEIVLFGPGTRGEPTAQDWAEALDTISYEIVTRIGPRVPRVYAGALAASLPGGRP